MILSATIFKHLRANPTKWSNTINNSSATADQLLSVFDHFVGLALEGLNQSRLYNH